MGRYRNVETRIWNDEKFRGLAQDSKLIFLFILTNPGMTPLGAMRGTIPGMAAELEMSLKGFSEGFKELLQKGLVEHDEKASFVGLPNFLKYNKPENPNVVKAWVKSVDVIPECELKVKALQRARDCAIDCGEPYAKVLPKGFGQLFRDGSVNHTVTVTDTVSKGYGIPFEDGSPNRIERVTDTVSKGLPIPYQAGMPNKEPEQEPETLNTKNSYLETSTDAPYLGNPSIDGIEIDGEIVGFFEDSLRWESKFVRDWNKLDGVVKFNYVSLDSITLKVLSQNLKDPTWDWRAAIKKFPLYKDGKPFTPTIRQFITHGFVHAVLRGEYDAPKVRVMLPEVEGECAELMAAIQARRNLVNAPHHPVRAGTPPVESGGVN